MEKSRHPTQEQTGSYIETFDFLNAHLFDGALNRPMLTFQRSARFIGGYFSADRWTNDEGVKVHEIAVNANVMKGGEGDLRELIGYLAHEMCHLWQHDAGKPTRNGYHNREWSDKAKAIGLVPRCVETGGEVGQAISTEIAEGGPLDKALAELPESAILPWLAYELDLPSDAEPPPQGGEGTPQSGDAQPQGSSGVRKKYTCPVCGINAWGKPGLSLICGADSQFLVQAV